MFFTSKKGAVYHTFVSPFDNNMIGIVNNLITFRIRSPFVKELNAEETTEIYETLSQKTVYFNSITCLNWCSDTKLQNGRWLTNIFWNNEWDYVECNLEELI